MIYCDICETADEQGCEDDELRDMCEILEGLDPNLINILKQVGEIDNAEIEIEMMEYFTKQEIVDTRLKVFEAAKEKAARSLRQANAGGIFGPEYICDPESFLLSKMAVDQWELVARRKVHNFAKDTLELLSFALDADALFPAKVVKKLSLNKGSFENVPDAEEVAFAKLSEDIELANGNYSVEIVNSAGSSETHLITVEPAQPDNVTPCVSQPDIIDTSIGSPSNGNTDDVDSVDDSVDEQERDTISTNQTAEDISHNDPLVELIRNFVDMSKRMLEAVSGREQPSQTAEQYHRDYVERITLINRSKMKVFEKWQKSVDDRLDRLEKSTPSNPRVAPRNANDKNATTVDEVARSSVPRQPSTSAPTKVDKTQSARGKASNTGKQGAPNSRGDFGRYDNEPPVDAVSQRRPADDRRVQINVGDKKADGSKNTITRKQFPPRSISETPNPRLAANRVNVGYRKGPNVPPKPDNDNEDGHQSFEDVNPYSPLADELDTAPVEVPKRKSPTFGRGRGRKRNDLPNPGANPRKPIGKQTQDKVRTERVVNTVDTGGADEHAPVRATEVSSSWYDDEDEAADKSLFDAMDHHDNSEWNDNEEDSHHNDDILLDIREPTTSSRDRQADNTKGNERGRKRTSTREAPFFSPQHDTDVGKSAAPLNKKPKFDSKTSHVRKASYSDALEKNQWNKAGGRKKRRSQLGNRRIPELKSAAEVALREIYIQELDCSTCRGSKEFEEMVLDYCRKRGLNAVDACTIPVKNCRTKSGCKLTVQQDDYDTAMGREFWPRGTTLRPWSSKPRNDTSDEGDDQSSSE